MRTDPTEQAMADEPVEPRAVEVTAMLGNSVIGVKHCMDPTAGKVSNTTRALFAIGGISFVALVFAFGTALANAAYNEEQFAYQTIQLRKPDYAVRPRMLPVAFDWLAVGGLAAALLTMTSALARMHKEKQTPWVRIGSAPGVEFATEIAPTDSFSLVEPHGDDFAFKMAPGMEGEVIVGGQSTSLAELVGQGHTMLSPIPANARIRVHAGNAMFLVSSVAQPRKYATPGFALERPFMYSLAGTAAAAAMIVLVLFQISVEDSSANIELASLEHTSTRAGSKAPDDSPPILGEALANHEPEQADASLALSTRSMGNPNSSRVEGRHTMKWNRENPQLAREQAIEQARTAGILGSAVLVPSFASLTGIGDISSGFDDTNIYGGLLGSEVGEQYGNFGFGPSGFGLDRGGPGWGTIGSGRYGTIGETGACGPGCMWGGRSWASRRSERTPVVPTVTLCGHNSPGSSHCLRIDGAMDKAIIRRYIKRNIDKISYCYEKELLAQPNLAGTVMAQFFILPTGTVMSSQGSGVDPQIANCVAEVIGAIEFPRSANGSGAQVNYPFTFRPTGV